MSLDAVIFLSLPPLAVAKYCFATLHSVSTIADFVKSSQGWIAFATKNVSLFGSREKVPLLVWSCARWSEHSLRAKCDPIRCNIIFVIRHYSLHWLQTSHKQCSQSAVYLQIAVVLLEHQVYLAEYSTGRTVTSLGHQGWQRLFWEGPNIFKLCPVVFSYAQHIFPGGGKNILEGGILPPWLRAWQQVM